MAEISVKMVKRMTRVTTRRKNCVSVVVENNGVIFYFIVIPLKILSI